MPEPPGRRTSLTPLAPVLAVSLFPREREALLAFLQSLDSADWERPTACPGWSLKDIAAHLLADDLGRLSGSRDGHAAQRFASSDAATFEADLLAFINAQNEAWVSAARRLSRQVIIDLLRWSGEQTQAYFGSLDPNAPAAIGVSWAGELESANWFDLAREYTERWHHQAQIREAVSAPMLYEPDLFAPLIDTLVRALPHTFRNTDAEDGTHIAVAVRMPSRREEAPSLCYSLVREAGRWGLYRPLDAATEATVTMDGDVAWRVFTKGITPEEAIARSTVESDQRLAWRVFETVSIIA